MKFAVSILFIIGVFLFLLEFISNRFLNYSFTYLSGFRNYLILISTFLAMTTGILKDKNIKMDILSKYKDKSGIYILKNSMSIIISLLITFLFIKYMIFENNNNTKMFFNINKYFFIVPYIIVFLISAFMYLLNIIIYLKKKVN